MCIIEGYLYTLHFTTTANMKRGIEDISLEDSVACDDQNLPSQKRKRMSRFEGTTTSEPIDTVLNGMPSSQNIQELLANTKKKIEERKKQTEVLLAHQKLPTAGLLPTPNVPPVNVYPTAEHVMSSAMSEAVEKAKKAAEVRGANQWTINSFIICVCVC